MIYKYFALFELTCRQLLGGRRALGALGVALVPAILAGLIRMLNSHCLFMDT